MNLNLEYKMDDEQSLLRPVDKLYYFIQTNNLFYLFGRKMVEEVDYELKCLNYDNPIPEYQRKIDELNDEYGIELVHKGDIDYSIRIAIRSLINELFRLDNQEIDKLLKKVTE